jgi:hypothetical protein
VIPSAHLSRTTVVVSAINKAEVGHKFFFSREWSSSGHISQEYEKLKREWSQNHPEATSQEYELAISKIARELGY